MRADDIIAWLSQPGFTTEFIQIFYDDNSDREDATQPSRGALQHQHEPLSPPNSGGVQARCKKRQRRERREEDAMADQDSHRTPKRLRPSRDNDDDEYYEGRHVDVDVDLKTPRASSKSSRSDIGRRAQQWRRGLDLDLACLSTASSPSHSQSSASRSYSHSHASGRTSPSKQMAALELGADGLETRVLTLDKNAKHTSSMPLSLRHLLAEIARCSNGVGILSEELRAEIVECNREEEVGEFSDVLDSTFVDAQSRRALGPTPSLDEVAFLVQEASDCQATMESEAGWNMMVHYPVLSKAVYGLNRGGHLIGVKPCTTARIIKEYLPVKSQAKMVDFCLYVNPDEEKEEQEQDPFSTSSTSSGVRDAIRHLRQVLPCNVINHTNFLSLRNCPIAVSIETKKRGTGQQDAELQIGTWHAAQWNFLQQRVAETGGSFEGLDFLPAIVIQGHDWSFAATTREASKTVLWLEKTFGSTASSLDTYKVVWGLQRLASWSEQVYWPWYKKNVLGV